MGFWGLQFFFGIIKVTTKITYCKLEDFNI